jgi:uncharacterized protein YcbK (DUF882 family)
MSHMPLKTALAVVSVVLSFSCATAQDSASPHMFFSTSPPDQQKTVAGNTSEAVEKAPAKRRTAGIQKQISSVSTGCLKPALMAIISNASQHFGSPAVITSGYRAGRRSYHGKCMAADVQIAGVAPSTLARYFRRQDGVGGVGTYEHTRSVHVDVAPRSYTWHHGRRKNKMAA